MKPSELELALNNSATQYNRLTKILWAVEFALLVALVYHVAIELWSVCIQLIFTGIAIAIVHRLLKSGRQQIATLAFLSIITLSMSLLMWDNEGLRDEALLTFPTILLFAVMVGNRKFFYILLGCMIGIILLNGLFNTTGYISNRTSQAGLSTGIIISVILLVTGFTGSLIFDDIQRLLERLLDENEEVKKSREQIAHLAKHDNLTNLPNRVLAEEFYNRAISKSKRENTLLALLYIDLDNFKAVNDALGHQNGDLYLKEVSLRIQNAVRECDTICRQGGDEFLILLENIKHEHNASKVAVKVLDALANPIMIEGTELITSSSIGIILCPNDADDFNTACKRADTAMYHVKQTGKNGFSFYDSDMNVQAHEHIKMLADMRSSMQDNHFSLYYQPQVDLATGKIVGAEALLRWIHPEKGFISPAEFIPLAEKSGLIAELGAWVIHTAASECKQWQDLGYNNVPVAINVSAIQFQRDDVLGHIEQALTETGLHGSSVEVEITESLLVDDLKQLMQSMMTMKNMGVRFAIDDFGTGYSNLGYLKKFEIDTLKIDQSFVQKMNSDGNDRAIVEAIIQIASKLNIKTVFEGVEDKATADLIAELGSGKGQGYYWAKPMPLKDFTDFLTNQRG